MPTTLQTQRPTPWTRTVIEFLTAVWAKVAALFVAAPAEADRRAAEKRRRKEIRRRLRGLS